MKALGIHMWAMVFNQPNPSLLSMGKLVKEFDACTHWEADDHVLSLNNKQIEAPSSHNVPIIALEWGTRSEIGDSDDEESSDQHTSARESSHAEDPTSARESSLDDLYAMPSQSGKTEEQVEKRRAKSRRSKRAAKWGNAKTIGTHNQFAHFPFSSCLLRKREAFGI